jgi:RNA polymerase sigma-70 factor (ECF subfamily)
VSPPSPARLLRIAGRAAPASGTETRPGVAAEGPSDAELARLARDRDRRAATLVWDRYADVVRGVLYRTMGPDRDLEDLVQDVFVGFFRNVSTLRLTSSLRPFLVGIAIRTAKTALRKRRVRRWLHLSDDGTLPEVPMDDGDPRTREAVRRLFAVLGELDDRDRLAFVLRHAEGHELTEAASALDVSLATLKRCLGRAEEYVLTRARNDDLLSAWAQGGSDE